MNMDEHLEEIEDDFGSELAKTASTSSGSGNKAGSAPMPWLSANGIKLNIQPKAPRKSRWSSEAPNTTKTENIINPIAEKYYGKQISQSVPTSSQYPSIISPAGLVMPPGGFMSQPMFMPKPLPSIPVPPFIPTIPPPTQIIPKEPIRKRISSRSRSRSRTRSPPHRRSRYRSRSRSRDRYSRSPDISDGINMDHLTSDERRMMEENKIFAKLLLTKMMGIKSNQRLENLHVSLMSIVKKALDEEMIENYSKRY